MGHPKSKLKKVDSAIKETLTCVLARSILVYIGTPMVAASLWKREDIDRMEAQLFRQINGLPNIISNKAIMNVACSMRNAWEIVDPPRSKSVPVSEEVKTATAREVHEPTSSGPSTDTKSRGHGDY